MSYYEEKIKQILDKIRENEYPPVFENCLKWKLSKTNCYAYALNLLVDDSKKKIFIPGCMADQNEDKFIWTGVTDRVKKDLDFLGISYRDDDDLLKPGEWKIAIYYIPTPHDFPIGFHISRQDKDGSWSEKASWKSGIKSFKEESDTPPNLTNKGPILEKVLILKKSK